MGLNTKNNVMYNADLMQGNATMNRPNMMRGNTHDLLVQEIQKQKEMMQEMRWKIQEMERLNVMRERVRNMNSMDAQRMIEYFKRHGTGNGSLIGKGISQQMNANYMEEEKGPMQGMNSVNDMQQNRVGFGAMEIQ
eukprot:355562_1